MMMFFAALQTSAPKDSSWGFALPKTRLGAQRKSSCWLDGSERLREVVFP